MLNLSKFKNKHFLSLMGNAVISVFGLVLFAFLYREFSKDDVGTWFFFMATQGVLDAIRNGFLGTATIKFYAGTEPKRASEVMGSVWYLAILVTLLFLAVNGLAFLALPFTSNVPVIVTIKWVGITTLSSLPFSVIYWKLQADEKYGTMLWVRLVNSGSTLLAFLVLMFLGKLTLESALLWNLLTNCLTSVVGLLAGLGGSKNIIHRTRSSMLEIYHFGKYSLATTLSSNLLRVADTYIVTFMLGPGALAVLSLPWKLMELVEMPLRSFVGTGMSAMATAYNQDNMYHFRHVMNKYAGMLTMAFIPMAIGMFFLADIPVNLVSSGKYAGTEAANLYRIIMFMAIIYPTDRFNGVALDLIHQPKINFQKVQVMLVAKIVGNFVFIYLMKNVYAINVAGFFTLLSGLAFGYYHLNKHIEFRISDILKTGYFESKQLVLKLAGKGQQG